MTVKRSARLAAFLPAALLVAATAGAQIRTDGSLGRGPQALVGPQFTIPEALGVLRGANLFHSFSVFNILPGESATFTTATRGIANVVSRVTGGEPSTINGLLRLAPTDGAPAFFFINPSGVTFGAGAALDVPGAIHISTADYVKFPDGNFHADAAAASTLSSASPEAFGFLGSHRAAVEVGAGARLIGSLLQPFSITAGDITIDNARASATGGDIRIVALGNQSAEVPLAGPLPAASGELRIVDGGIISAPAGLTVDAGRLSVSAGDILIDRGGSASVTGLVSQSNTGNAGNAGTVDVRASGSLQLVNGGVISSSTFSSGNAGAVIVNAASVVIDGSGAATLTGIFSQADRNSTGRAGTVNVTATGRVDVVEGGLVSSSAFGAGDAGEVRLSGATISLDGHGSGRITGVVNNASDGSGNAGPVSVTATGTLSLANGATISSSTLTSGNAGTVVVRARDILMDGAGYEDILTSISSNARTGSSGRAGNIDIAATRLLSVVGGAEISSSAFESGDAGKVSVAADRIVIDAQGTSYPATGIFSTATDEARGNAGSIDIDVRQLVVRNGGEIATSTFGPGDAGRISIRAGDILVDGAERGYAAIASSAEFNAGGTAGSVDIRATGDVSLLSGGEIASNTFWTGQAGTVNVSARNLTIDGRDSDGTTGIMSQTYADATGNGGNVSIAVSDTLTLLAHGFISSGTFSAGNGGSVDVNAGRIVIDGTGGGVYVTGITSGAQAQSTGNAGAVTVTTPGSLTILDAGEISSSTFSAGNAGAVTVRAGSMTVDARANYAGIFSTANERSTGHAGSIDVAVAGLLTLKDQGKITSSTFGAGNAGTVRVAAGELAIDGGSLGFSFTGIASNADRPGTGNAGRVDVNVAGAITIAAGGEIASSTFTSGDSASVTVHAGSLLVDGKGDCPPCTGIYSQAERGSSGRAGQVDVTVAGDLELRHLGHITTGTNNAHDAGRTRVQARNIVIDGGGYDSDTTGILSNAISGTGSAGIVDVTATQGIVLRDGGVIGSSTYSAGSAGTVNVTAGTIDIRDYPSSISTAALFGSTGDAGNVVVNAGAIRIANAGTISSSTFGEGDAGRVKIAAESLLIDRAGAIRETGVSSHAEGGAGNGGSNEIVAGEVAIMEGGSISSTSYGDGNAGSVSLRARRLLIDGGEDNWANGITSETVGFGSGRAGTIDIVATEDIFVARGGYISSSSGSYGPAGSVSLSAPNITLLGGRFNEFQATGVETRAGFYSSAAGSVSIHATERLQVLNGAVITASTSSFSGEAGSVVVNAGDVVVDGERSSINARAENFSRGQSGSVTVDAGRSITVSNGGEIAITNLMSLGGPYPWTITPTLLSVTAPVIELRDGGTISAASLGDIPASNIAVNVGQRMVLDNASITTSAVDGNGGSITLTGDGVVVLRNSQITTSVTGLAGNGGDITIATRGLVLDTGFIQANTAAQDAAGGKVSIDVGFLIPSGNTLFVGGSEPLEFRPGVFGLNVIQAAAPTGVSGAIDITTPALDVSGGLIGLTAKVLDGGGLGRSLCDVTGGSSLALATSGSMPLAARDFMRSEHIQPPTVARLPTDGTVLARITCPR
jgi:filamentous hemagglutinin family protein